MTAPTMLGSTIAILCGLGLYYMLSLRGRHSIHGPVRPQERYGVYFAFAIGGALLARDLARVLFMPSDPEHMVRLVASVIVCGIIFLSVRLLDRQDS